MDENSTPSLPGILPDPPATIEVDHVESSRTPIPIIRQNLDSLAPDTRFMIGFAERRPMQIPVYSNTGASGVLLHHRKHPKKTVEVFRMVGWGETIEKAAAVALKNGVSL